MRKLALLLLLLLPSCGISSVFDKVDKVLTWVNENKGTVTKIADVTKTVAEKVGDALPRIQEFGGRLKEVAMQADKNKDGKLDTEEIILGGSLLAKLLWDFVRNKASDKRKDLLAIDVDRLKQRNGGSSPALA